MLIASVIGLSAVGMLCGILVYVGVRFVIDGAWSATVAMLAFVCIMVLTSATIVSVLTS